MNMNTTTLPKRGLKTRQYSMDMNKNIVTLPKKGLKTKPYNIDMEKKDLEKLSKNELIKLLLNQYKKKPKVVIVDDTKPTLRRKQKVVDDRPGWVRNPNTNRWIKYNGPTYQKLYPMQHALNRMDMTHQEINETSKSIDDKYKSIMPSLDDVKPYHKPPLPPNDGFNFDNDIFQTENTSLGKFKIVGIRNRENKKFKSYTNEFRVKILKELDNDNEIYHIFQELVKTVKKRRNLSNNDMIKVVIQNEELPNAISTKFTKVESFKLGDLENVINILEYRAIPIEKCKTIVQSVKIPTGKGRLYLTKDTISRKCCIITVKNDDTICLARAVVTSLANLHPEKWTKTQLHDGFNKSRNFRRKKQ